MGFVDIQFVSFLTIFFNRFVLKKSGCIHPVARIFWVGVGLPKLLPEDLHGVVKTYSFKKNNHLAHC